MNIKSVANPISSLDSMSSTQGTEKVKTFESADRDANGKQEQPDQEPERELSEEELELALEKMKSMPAVKENNLIIMAESINGVTMVFVKSPYGEIIRRMTPFQAMKSTEHIDLDRPKGQLLNRAM
ncbi:MAG: hypothetical protein HRT45_07985 [Bdellovibrionales bacterium]|nr:hypothetical protein [Bdellovibrionales bacterium]